MQCEYFFLENDAKKMRHTLPRSRGHALVARANNFPIGTTDKRAFSMIKVNAGAAWRHHCGTVTYFTWHPSQKLGPRATLMYIVNGPEYFAREWVRLVVHEVVARSKLLSMLSDMIWRKILFEYNS